MAAEAQAGRGQARQGGGGARLFEGHEAAVDLRALCLRQHCVRTGANTTLWSCWCQHHPLVVTCSSAVM